MLRVMALLVTAAVCAADSAYEDAVAKWREQREAALKADGGWLTVTGLFWLKEGPNRVATVPGVFEFNEGKTVFRADPGGHVTASGKPVSTIEMGPKTAIEVGDLTFTVIERAGRYGVRMKDKQSKLRKEFHGLQWFPIRESYRITAKFVRQSKQVSVPNIIGSHFEMTSPGYVVFQMDGREMRLEPVIEDDENELFFIFRDQTAGKETYPAGRFLYTALPRDGRVELDFNKAENPPCAFTPYATCPLPPKQNVLPVRIEAGERMPPGKPATH